MACRAPGPPAKAAKLAGNDRLRHYIQQRLAGRILAASAAICAGMNWHPLGGPDDKPMKNNQGLTAVTGDQACDLLLLL